jgi:hypothetical protein
MTTTLFEQADKLVKEIGNCKMTIDKLKNIVNNAADEKGIHIYFSAYSNDAYYVSYNIINDLIVCYEKELEALMRKFKELK